MRGRLTSRIGRVGLWLGVALLLCAGAYHAIALSAYAASKDAPTLAERAAGANRAASLEPWNRTFEVRAIRLQAERLFDEREYDAAHALMQPVIAAGDGGREFVAYYHEVTRVWADKSSAKAHLQHGHEGPGGTLTTSDIER